MEASGFRCPACSSDQRQQVRGFPIVDTEYLYARYILLTCTLCEREWDEVLWRQHR